MNEPVADRTWGSPVSSIDRLMRTALRAGHAEGLVAIAANSRDILYSGAHGRRAMAESNRTMTDTVFRTCALVKPVTGLALLQLSDSGCLDLDDRIDGWLPQSEAIRKFRSAVMLASSRWGGLPSFRQLLMFFADSDSSISDTAVACAKEAVARASGTSFEDYIRDNILSPLNMHETYFSLPASSHRRTGETRSGPRVQVANSMSPIAAESLKTRMEQTALYSTGLDSLKLLQAILRQDADLLPGQVYQEFVRSRPLAAGLHDAVTYFGRFNTYCWIDWSSDTAGLLYAQLIPHDHPSLDELFSDYRDAVYTRSTKKSGRSRLVRVLEFLLIPDSEYVWP